MKTTIDIELLTRNPRALVRRPGEAAVLVQPALTKKQAEIAVRHIVGDIWIRAAFDEWFKQATKPVTLAAITAHWRIAK